MERLILRSAAVCTRRPWWVVAIWIVLLAAALPFSGKAQGVLSSGGFDVPGSQSQQAIDYLNNQPGRGAYSFSFLVDAPTAAAAQARVAQVRAQVAARYPEIHFTTAPQDSPDGGTISFVGFASVDQNRSLTISRDLKTLVQSTDPPVRTFLLGPSANYATFQDITEKGLQRAELLSSPVILIVLLVLFGAVVAMLVPAALGALSVLITFALVYLVASHTEVSVYATTMVTMIGIGVAVDYSMFILARFREELLAGAPTDRAVATAMATSGTAVAFSGMTVIVSLASIWIVPVRAVQSMALAAIMVVTVAVLAAMTLLPAVLMLLGPRINALRIPGRKERPRPRGLLDALDARRHAPSAAVGAGGRHAADRAVAARVLDGDRQPVARAAAAVHRCQSGQRDPDQADHRPRPGPRGRAHDPGAPAGRRRLQPGRRGRAAARPAGPRSPGPGRDGGAGAGPARSWSGCCGSTPSRARRSTCWCRASAPGSAAAGW